MKKAHRRVHAVSWLALLPVLMLVIYLAQQTRQPIAPPEAELQSPSAAGVLP